jgi:hypothetical protein
MRWGLDGVGLIHAQREASGVDDLAEIAAASAAPYVGPTWAQFLASERGATIAPPPLRPLAAQAGEAAYDLAKRAGETVSAIRDIARYSNDVASELERIITAYVDNMDRLLGVGRLLSSNPQKGEDNEALRDPGGAVRQQERDGVVPG